MAGEDFSENFESVIDGDPKYVIASSYSFSIWTKWYEKLKKLDCPRVVIIPFRYCYGDKEYAINTLEVIKTIINDGIGVIIDSLNHAKFILTDKRAYDGSNNLTKGGFITNVENSNFYGRDTEEGVFGYNECNSRIMKYFFLLLKCYGNYGIALAKVEKLEKYQISNIKWKIQKDEFEKLLNDISICINEVEELSYNIRSMNDSFQHLRYEYREIISNTYRKLKEISKFSRCLEIIYIKLKNELEIKDKYNEIWLKNTQVEEVNSKIEEINKNIKDLCSDYYDELRRYKKIILIGNDINNIMLSSNGNDQINFFEGLMEKNINNINRIIFEVRKHR